MVSTKQGVTIHRQDKRRRKAGSPIIRKVISCYYEIELNRCQEKSKCMFTFLLTVSLSDKCGMGGTPRVLCSSIFSQGVFSLLICDEVFYGVWL